MTDEERLRRCLADEEYVGNMAPLLRAEVIRLQGLLSHANDGWRESLVHLESATRTLYRQMIIGILLVPLALLAATFIVIYLAS